MFEHLDPQARRIFELAQHEARALNHNYVGTEHLLLGLLRAGDRTADLLASRGCGRDEIRREIISIIGRGTPPRREPDALLATLGIDLGEVRRRVESTFGSDAMAKATLRVRPRRRWPGHRWWPGCDQGRPVDSALIGGRWFGVAPRVKKIVEMATTASAPSLATPADLLLAIVNEGEGVACEVLTRRRVDLVSLAAALRDRNRRPPA